MSVAKLAGHDLGTRTTLLDPDRAALYALAIGARPDQLELVYERDLAPLPTIAMALGLWVTEAAADQGGYDPADVLHVGQSLSVRGTVPLDTAMVTAGRVANVWDKGSAAILDLRVETDAFECSYQMLVKGAGGWGGPRGSAPKQDESALVPTTSVALDERAAALYRLTGDRHPVHIDPEVAARAGFERPILHGLCTLGTVVRAAVEATGRSALDVRSLSARFHAPVLPGDTLDIATSAPTTADDLSFAAAVGDRRVLSGALAVDGDSKGPR